MGASALEDIMLDKRFSIGAAAGQVCLVWSKLFQDIEPLDLPSFQHFLCG